MRRERLHRPYMTVSVKRVVWSRQNGVCGCGCGEPLSDRPKATHYDHHPALGLRRYNPATKTYTPGANDPRFIQALLEACHHKKTFGSGATCVDGDSHKIPKARRVSQGHDDHHEAMRQKQTRDGKDKSPVRMKSRPFQTNKGSKYMRPIGSRKAVLRNSGGAT